MSQKHLSWRHERPRPVATPVTMPLDDSRGTIRPMMQLALPVFVSQSLILIVGYTDWWLTGHYLTGSAPKAAMGLMAYYMWMLQSLFSVFQIGATALVARFIGARQHRRAERVLPQALLAGNFQFLK